MIGRRYVIPRPTRLALERVFEAPVDGIIVIENSLYARAHLGMRATTRPNRIRERFDRYLRELKSVNSPREPIAHGG